jgi:hypothetical protein
MSKYPELDNVAEAITDSTCALINRLTRDVESNMPYKQQFVLEEVIRQLKERV